MKKNTSTLYDSVTNDRTISTTIEDFLITEAVNGPTVTISMVIELLKIINNRLSLGQEIIMEKTGTVLTSANFEEYLNNHFSEYIRDEVLA
ncbi:MAG: hypothetical protein ACI4D3_00495 [Lachnospiraceae bacterium]